jgi:hypothetical protein
MSITGMWKIFDPSGHKTATVNTSYFDASKVYIDDPTKPGPFDQAEIGGSIGGSDGDGDGDSAEDGEDNPAQPTGDKCWDDEMQDGNAGKKTRRTLAMALVLGGVGGAVVVTAVIVGFVIFLVRRKRRGYDSISDKNGMSVWVWIISIYTCIYILKLLICVCVFKVKKEYLSLLWTLMYICNSCTRRSMRR